MILAGDVGGTKTVLGLFSRAEAGGRPIRQARFDSRDHDSLEAIVAEFLKDTGSIPAVASFGIAGPVLGRRAKVTNLPWEIDADAIAAAFGIPSVHLLNDLQAIATVVPHLSADALCALSAGRPDPTGTKAVIAPGTGLGISFLTWTGTRYQAHPTEGGHASFAPATPEQVELLAFLARRFGHVSCERVCSGSGIPNLYDFLRAAGSYDEPDWLRQALAEADDPTPVIVTAGLERRAEIAVAVLDMFVRILGGVVGNVALKVLATGGLYLGGGIPPRILARLRQPDFLQAITHKGRFSTLLSNIPVSVILDPESALHGAAFDALHCVEG
ncbi:MAG: glucokinase [Rhodospirillales bacterium]